MTDQTATDIRRRPSRDALAALSLLGAFGFATGTLGHLSPQMNGLLLLLSSLSFMALRLSPLHSAGGAAWKRLLAPAGAAVALLILLRADGGEVGRCLSVTFFVLVVYWLGRRRDAPGEGAAAVALTAAVAISLYVVLLKFVPPVWHAAQWVSLAASGLIGRAAGEPMRLGATASGAHVFVFFTLYLLCLFYRAEPRPWRALACAWAAGLALYALYLVLSAWAFVPFLRLFQNSYHAGHSHYQAYQLTQLNTTLFLLVMLGAPLAWAARGWRPRGPRAADKSVGRWATACALGACLLLAFGAFGLTANVRPRVPAEGGRVVLYDKGYLDWKLPVFGQYGERSGGMFGLLPDFLRGKGFEVTRAETLSDEVLRDCRILVVINLQQPFPPAEHEAVWRFVGGGGSLLALGDHTGVAGIREPFDELLRPVGIRFRFDSAHYVNDWEHAFEVFPHPVTREVAASRELAISIGASLEVPATAAPLVTGRYGYSDRGNANNGDNAFLGDRRYNPGELLGDIVLVAAADYGRGRVLVFGDTSSFQNAALVGAHRFVGRVFEWLGAPAASAAPVPRAAWAAALLLCAALAGLLLRRGALAAAAPHFAAALLVGLAASALHDASARDDAVLRGDVAYIDTSHVERVEHKYDGDNSFFGLSYNLMRSGYLPLEMKQFSAERLLAGKVFVALAPTRAFSAAEVAAVEKFMQQGGTFIICLGWEEAANLQPLLGRFGLRVENVPLGPVAPESNDRGIHFYNAWPVRLERASGARVLCALKEPSIPLVVEQAHGPGRLIVVGDSHFLGGVNLESYESFNEENIDFLRDVLNHRPRGEAVALTEGGKGAVTQ